MMKRRILFIFKICNENRLFKLIIEIMINYNNIILLSISK